jgi:arylsulfatase A-like enzyme
VDTLRADHLGCYGYFRDTSPRIDALARQSVLFEDCAVPMATTLPSHLSMLTGAWPFEHGVLANATQGGQRFVRSAGLVSCAEVLAEAGYATAGFISAKPLQRWTGIDAGFQHYDGPEAKERRGGETVDRALAWLRTQRAAEPERPFFLWVHLFDPHAPFEAPAPYTGTFEAGSELDAFLAERGIEPLVHGPNGMPVESRPSHDLYDAEILYTDGQVGRLLDALTEQGLDGQAAVLFMSDHGEGLGQHGVARHGLVWNELVRSAFLLRVPGLSPRRVSAPVSSIDAFPTLLEHLHIPGRERFLVQSSGVNALAPGFEGRPQWSQSSARLRAYGQDLLIALRRGRWKYVWQGEATGALYDLEVDTHELRDVAQEYPEVAAELRGEVLRLRAEHERRGAALGSGALEDMDAEALQALKDLGYVGDE